MMVAVSAFEKMNWKGQLVIQTELKEVVIPEGVTEIGESAFYVCSVLERVKLPASLKKIGRGAFGECKNLRDISFPDGLVFIGENVFDSNAVMWTENDDDSYCKDGLYYVGSYLVESRIFVENNCTVAEGTCLIADQTFLQQEIIVTVKLPDSLVYIGKKAFSHCSGL